MRTRLNAGGALLRNCILWNNTATVSGTNEIYNNPVIGKVTTVSYSCIQDDDPNDANVFPGTANIDDDPVFVNPIVNDYHLGGTVQVPSPCKDAGNNPHLRLDRTDLDWDGDIDEQTPFDLDALLARIQFANVDMGAFEFGCGEGLEAPTAPLVGDEAGFEKNRFISILPGNSGAQTALRVTHVGSGSLWWIGAPTEIC